MINRREVFKGLAALVAAPFLSGFYATGRKPTVEEYVAEQGPAFLEEFLYPWLRIPSVSSDEQRKGDVARSADHLVRGLIQSGLDARRIELERGNPIVYAERKGNPDSPTVLIYGHHDVQPIDDLSAWTVGGQTINPFEPTVVNERIYARGATDDKGPLSAHVLAMKYFNEQGWPDCTIKFIVEGNEESGGSTIGDFVRKNAALLACDAIIVSDTTTLAEGYPCLTTSLKGIVVGTVTAERPEEIIQLIHKAHDPKQNRVLLPQFYDGVIEQRVEATIEDTFGAPETDMGGIIRPEDGFSQLEHRWYRPTFSPLFIEYANPNPEEKLGTKTIKITASGPKTILHSGAYGGPTQEPSLLLAHLLAGLREDNVTYDLDWIQYGSRNLATKIFPTGEAQITVSNELNIDDVVTTVARRYHLARELFEITEVNERRAYLNDKRFTEESYTAAAHLSFRIVPEQDPEMVMQGLETFAEMISKGIKISGDKHLGRAFSTSVDNPYVEAVRRGLQQGYGTSSSHLMAIGGSIRITHALRDILHAPVILAGFAPPSGNYHGALENIPPREIFNGTRSIVYALQIIAML